jgi:tetratricopeptide (TPR) repeat protein
MTQAKALYEEAILLLDEHATEGGEDRRERAGALLSQAIASRPAHARSHAALGHVYDMEENMEERALACFREAHRLDPKDKVAEVYALVLLAEMGREAEALAAIEAAAPRHELDLALLRCQLAEAHFPADARTLVGNGFLRPSNYFNSWLGREAARIRNRREPGRAGRHAQAERQDCWGFQRKLEERFEVSRVPRELHELAVWASRYGVGDDYCRPYLLKRLTKKQKQTLIRAVDAHADAIDRWLNAFAPGEMSDEAAAFMYLAEGAEEIRD